MENMLNRLFETVETRRNEAAENSYTAYLFSQGVDKILKKCGEESAEMIIAAKNKDKNELIYEACDLLYHMTVLLVNEGVSFDDIDSELERRHGKTGNLKQMRTTDKNS